MEGADRNPDASARRYEAILPDAIDVLLLGIGEDGHIASLFTGNPAVLETSCCVLSVLSPKPPELRLSITLMAITRVKQIFLPATGTTKGEVLAQAMKNREHIFTMPVRLVLGAV